MCRRYTTITDLPASTSLNPIKTLPHAITFFTFHHITIMNHQAILDNFCRQLLELQHNIATREENPNLPTEKEVNMQVRLINCIDKMSRILARQAKEAARQAAQPPAVKEQPQEATPQPVQYIHGDPPPLSLDTLTNYSYMLYHYKSTSPNDKIFVNGEKVNTMWLLYNVFQAHQPNEERRFIADADTFQRTVNKEELKRNIALYLELAKAA